MKFLKVASAVLCVIMLSCNVRNCNRIDLLPIDPDFDHHVNAVISSYETVHNEFVSLQHDYNNHLSETNHDILEGIEYYEASCKRKSVTLSYDDSTLSDMERLRRVDAKIDNLVDCAWDFEQAYSLHHNEFHGEWHVKWAKFYSSVPDSLQHTVYIRCVEENLKGIKGFLTSLRLDFEDHLNKYHNN